MNKFVITFLFVISQRYLSAQHQSLNEADSTLAALYGKITNIRSGSWNYDSILLMNQEFKTKLAQTITENPQSLTFEFKKLNEKIFFTNSDDDVLRIYSWETWLGGTMRDFKNVLQFRSGSNISAKWDTVLFSDDAIPGGGFYSEIFKLNANQKTYYLLIRNFVLSTKDAANAIECYIIENDSLKEAKIIKTPQGMTHTIFFEFDFFSVVNRPERPVKLIYYDADKKTLRIPVVMEDGKVTRRFLDYPFNGNYFEYTSSKVKTQ